MLATLTAFAPFAAGLIAWAVGHSLYGRAV